jgi:hypothetical protein
MSLGIVIVGFWFENSVMTMTEQSMFVGGGLLTHWWIEGRKRKQPGI